MARSGITMARTSTSTYHKLPTPNNAYTPALPGECDSSYKNSSPRPRGDMLVTVWCDSDHYGDDFLSPQPSTCTIYWVIAKLSNVERRWTQTFLGRNFSFGAMPVRIPPHPTIPPNLARVCPSPEPTCQRVATGSSGSGSGEQPAADGGHRRMYLQRKRTTSELSAPFHCKEKQAFSIDGWIRVNVIATRHQMWNVKGALLPI